MKNILNYFPLDSPRESQKAVLEKISELFEKDKRVILLEAPVGSGKSAIAMTLAKFFKDSHIITPRKSLQDQYHKDFSDEVVLMKGRRAYPCTYPSYKTPEYTNVINAIESGKTPNPNLTGVTCGSGPCLNAANTLEFVKKCSSNGDYPCPYNVAIDTAQGHQTIIHNPYSFIFQNLYASRWSKRKLLVVDEAHEIENVIRELTSFSFVIYRWVDKKHYKIISTKEHLVNFLEDPGNKPSRQFFNGDDYSYEKVLGEYEAKLQKLKESSIASFVIDPSQESTKQGKRYTRLKIVRDNLGNSANNLLLDYGERVLLMSGTIYSKERFCKNINISAGTVGFIRVGSSFPKQLRPIYFKDKYKVNTSHEKWTENFQKIIDSVNEVFKVFKDVKGLIHTPSYSSSKELELALNSRRVMSHDKENFIENFKKFTEDKTNKVFISPICQQGVDLKGDLARFQIILRVPNLNTQDPFVEKKLKEDFQWYNYQRLVVFGQQIGRINRSETDFGVTVLIDSRFEDLLRKNRSILPQWVLEAIIT